MKRAHPEVDREQYELRYVLCLEYPPKCANPECKRPARFDHIHYFYHEYCHNSCAKSHQMKREYQSGTRKCPWMMIRDADNKIIEDHPRNKFLRIAQYIARVHANRTKLLSGNHVFQLFPGRSYAKNCLFVYNDKQYRLRSSLEFIFACYLSIKGYNWTYETARVRDTMGKVWFNDFVVNKTIFEIKPDIDKSLVLDSIQNTACKDAGYKLRLVMGSVLRNKCWKFLQEFGFPIAQLFDDLYSLKMTKFNFDSYILNLTN